jgi:hypothetical protein
VQTSAATEQPSARSVYFVLEEFMGATSDELMDIARAGAERIDMPDERVRYPSFSDIEEQCANEYDELLNALHDDELFQSVDLQKQEDLVEKLKSLLGDEHEELLEELVDNQTRHLWLHQEAAFHLGMAVGLRLAQGRRH